MAIGSTLTTNVNMWNLATHTAVGSTQLLAAHAQQLAPCSHSQHTQPLAETTQIVRIKGQNSSSCKARAEAYTPVTTVTKQDG